MAPIVPPSQSMVFVLSTKPSADWSPSSFIEEFFKVQSFTNPTSIRTHFNLLRETSRATRANQAKVQKKTGPFSVKVRLGPD
jgi:hypothetical protein